ncbi:MAG: hypothetical protein ABJB93_01770, partial [Gaiellales bacterium]
SGGHVTVLPGTPYRHEHVNGACIHATRSGPAFTLRVHTGRDAVWPGIHAARAYRAGAWWVGGSRPAAAATVSGTEYSRCA